MRMNSFVDCAMKDWFFVIGQISKVKLCIRPFTKLSSRLIHVCITFGTRIIQAISRSMKQEP